MPRLLFWTSAIFLYSVFFLLKFEFPIPWVWFALGVAVGVYFFFLDRMFRVMLEKNDQFFAGNLSKKLSLIANTKPVLTVFWALAGYVPLAVYVLTSSGSIFGSGLVLGIGLRYFMHLFENINRLPDLYDFYEFPAEFRTQKWGRGLIYGFLWIFVVMTLIALR